MWFHYSFINNFNYHPQTKFAKVMFFTRVCLSTGGGCIPACIAGGIPACLAGLQEGRGIPACHAGLQTHTQGEVEGPGLGGGSFQAHTRGGGFQAHTWGGPQAHTRGSLQAHTRGGVEGSGLGGGDSRPTPRGVSQHALRQTPPQQTATAAGGTHPTGMHSC